MRTIRIALSACLLIALGVACQREDTATTSETRPAANPETGATPAEVAPALSVTQWANYSGDPPTLESLRGQVVVLDFWAYW